MHKVILRAALLSSAALFATAAPLSASAATEPADDQSTSANQAGQANDKQSLSTADIIVIGSKLAQNAPISVSLKTTQPQAAISRAFIDNANAGSDFNELIALAPGVAISGTGNGMGLGESKATIRGFQDGEYNVTYDSIPFADTNNPTHHSTAFFPSNTIETVVVDRGPGNASQLGQATYGGNLNMYSLAVADERAAKVQAVAGSWNTQIARIELQSGRISSLNGAKFVLAGQFLRSYGALTNSPVNSKNLFFKAVLPLGEHNTLTALSTYNRNFYYQSDVGKGATCGVAQAANTQLNPVNCAATSNIGMYGYDYALGSDPTKQDYWQYNRTDKTTDFSYLRLQSDVSSHLSFDNRVYMYGYTNNTMSGNTKTVVTGFNTTVTPYTKNTNADIPGYNKMNKYRVIGYIGQADYSFKYGKIKVGGWWEHSNTWRHTFDFDWNTGLPSYDQNANLGTTATAAYPSIALANIKYEQNSAWNQYQLFGEFEIKPTEALSITPGIKYVHFTRSVNALVNADANRSPANTSATWTTTLPFATVNWAIKPNWSLYGQYAKGMYVPDLSSFYTPSNDAASAAAQSAALANVQPQTSTNYQAGTVWHGETLSVDFDGYVINVNNKIGNDTSVGAPSGALTNIGTVRYKGLEGQIAYMPTKGLTLFVNASSNYAHSATTSAQVAKAPFSTQALGAMYHANGLRISYSHKFTGPQYATEYSTVAAGAYRQYRISGYNTAEFAISQEFGKAYRLGLTVSNLFDSRAITAISNGKTYGSDDQYSFLPPRSFLVDFRAKM